VANCENSSINDGVMSFQEFCSGKLNEKPALGGNQSASLEPNRRTRKVNRISSQTPGVISKEGSVPFVR
jgi:hypothetical protein